MLLLLLLLLLVLDVVVVLVIVVVVGVVGVVVVGENVIVVVHFVVEATRAPFLRSSSSSFCRSSYPS